ncbi:N-acylneuraminate-9-phosphatase [Rhagoletis pomonella]|uniref:N-acylneuraminate-9-phosphatase n=1 Tax=Rhagoletis pomonella TaxID=28610 RepID=UPI001780E2E5|nr:N-acylneuraminate-9-phosphatase [Rhagoletis pomonella]
MAEGEIVKHKSTKNAANLCITASNSSNINNAILGENLKKITALFFDLDNTLIPTRSGDLKAVKKLSEVLENQFGLSKEESSIATLSFLKAFRRCPDNSQTSLDSWRTYLWREALPPRYKHLAEQIYPKWLQLRYRYLALSADYIQMLRRAREANFLLALITNGPSNAQWEKINKLHVSQYFDCMLVSSDLPWEKPNPQIFYAACNFLGVSPSQCAMFGDKLESDIKGGRLAGLGATFWIPLNPGEIDLNDVPHKPDFTLKQLLDLYKYFPTLNNTRNIRNNTNSTATSTSAQSNAVTTSLLTHGNNGALAVLPQYRRRGSQISHSRTISTCYSDLQRHQTHHQPLEFGPEQHDQESQDEWFNERLNQEQCRQRRGGSLPTMDYMNSEAENSSDSLFC